MKYTFIATIHVYDGIRTTVHKEQMTIEAETAKVAEKQLREKITNRYKILSHLGLSSLQLDLLEEETKPAVLEEEEA